jgi:hypothetical protein
MDGPSGVGRAKRGPLEFDAVESVAPSVLACTELATLMEESMLEIEHTKEALAEHRADGNAQRKVNAWLVRKAREAVARHLQAVHAMESEPGGSGLQLNTTPGILIIPVDGETSRQLPKCRLGTTKTQMGATKTLRA